MGEGRWARDGGVTKGEVGRDDRLLYLWCPAAYSAYPPSQRSPINDCIAASESNGAGHPRSCAQCSEHTRSPTDSLDSGPAASTTPENSCVGRRDGRKGGRGFESGGEMNERESAMAACVSGIGTQSVAYGRPWVNGGSRGGGKEDPGLCTVLCYKWRTT